MSTSDAAAVQVRSPLPPSAAQVRVIAAAVDLFAEHGVGGTSLQMIADAIGVTKAAIYHQYRTKDEIVAAAAEAELTRLIAVLDRAESQSSWRRGRDVLIAGIVDLTVERRHHVGTIMSDPIIARVFAEHERFREVMHRLRRLLAGDDAGAEARVRTAMVIAAISGAALHPFVVDLDDETLRDELRRLARRFLGLSS